MTKPSPRGPPGECRGHGRAVGYYGNTPAPRMPPRQSRALGPQPGQAAERARMDGRHHGRSALRGLTQTGGPSGAGWGLSPRMPWGSSPHLTPPHWPELTFSPVPPPPSPCASGSFCAGRGPAAICREQSAFIRRVNTVSPRGGVSAPGASGSGRLQRGEWGSGAQRPPLAHSRPPMTLSRSNTSPRRGP